MHLESLEGDLMSSLSGEGTAFEASMQLSSQRNLAIIRSFAPLLASNAIGALEDTLDELKMIQLLLPKMLANMPERDPGARDLTLDSLLGPPQLSAGIHLLEVIIYLCSNSLLPPDVLKHNQATHWVVDHVPMQSMGSLF